MEKRLHARKKLQFWNQHANSSFNQHKNLFFPKLFTGVIEVAERQKAGITSEFVVRVGFYLLTGFVVFLTSFINLFVTQSCLLCHTYIHTLTFIPVERSLLQSHMQ